MNVVDSSGWIEYFAKGPNADFFANALEAVDELVVPSISLLEVYRHVLRFRGRDEALRAVSAMHQGEVVDLDGALALEAGEAGEEHRLPPADAVIYAVARRRGAVLWTQDGDFEGLPGVEYRPKR